MTTIYPPEVIDTLATINAHPSDANIEFDPVPHIYTVHKNPDIKYTSVTTWIHTHFSHFDADDIIRKMMRGKNWNSANKYWGKTPDQIKAMWNKNGAEASAAGTEMHYRIECFHNMVTPAQKGGTYADFLAYYEATYANTTTAKFAKRASPEWQYFINYVRDYPHFKPYRTEWMVYHEELQLSGSIDMIYELPDGSLAIYDWKRAREMVQFQTQYKTYATTTCIKHLPDTNYWHYTLQLNMYKMILEEKYGKKVGDLCLVVLHPDNPNGNYMLYPVPNIQREIRALCKFRLQQVRAMNTPVVEDSDDDNDDSNTSFDLSKPMF